MSDRHVRATLVKLAAFVAVCVFSAVLVVNTLTDPLTGRSHTYHAVFTDAHGLNPGTDVTVAGVRVGTVTRLELVDGRAHVTFDARADQQVPADVRAVVRYADLLGARHLALVPGESGPVGELEPGATIPLDRTRPALDLTALFNGFKPLFDSIDPAEVNQLAREIVAVFQGEAGSLDGLLSKVVSLTAVLGSRDDVLGEVLTNLNAVLDTMGEHRTDLAGLVDGLAELTSFAADSRERIAGALDGGAELAGSLTSLLADIGPDLSTDVRRLRSLTSTMVENEREFEAVVREAPEFASTLGRTLDYGSWVNVYVCNLGVDIGGEPIDLGVGPHSEVCR
ncbi:phospholipid/cholesterol/gamma-HCH transport system substrate-binding protein [Amycolatopsis marina]|uniref:Phospholipid/cholesterol/gamma-HCH transport system substrate-binding protein n=1 Tax=Amycolatopsis marina TaxID=490629 RepID=A0A1I0ZTP7_9PSEU|nr:MCE family protein [Amycolatopsis marina]SFB28901.1 phospholipid/cholesterol/gamma-HCH transport system substrate-binding protein [Amycolatopsis marina]